MKLSDIKNHTSVIATELVKHIEKLSPNLYYFNNGSRKVPEKLKRDETVQHSIYQENGDFVGVDNHQIIFLYNRTYEHFANHFKLAVFPFNNSCDIIRNSYGEPVYYDFSKIPSFINSPERYIYNPNDQLLSNSHITWAGLENHYTLGSLINGGFNLKFVQGFNDILSKYGEGLMVSNMYLRYVFFEQKDFILIRGNISLSHNQCRGNMTCTVFIKVHKKTGEVTGSSVGFNITLYPYPSAWNDGLITHDFKRFDGIYRAGDFMPYNIFNVRFKDSVTDFSFSHSFHKNEKTTIISRASSVGDKLYENNGIDIENLNEDDLLFLKMLINGNGGTL